MKSKITIVKKSFTADKQPNLPDYNELKQSFTWKEG